MIKKQTNVREYFASRLRTLRVEQDLPATTLAALAGLRSGTPGYIERTHANVQLKTIAALARALRVRPTAFFCETTLPLNFAMTDDQLLTWFRDNVKAARIEAGQSQNELTTLAGLHRDYVWNLEKRGINATLDVVERLATSLNMQAVGFFEIPMPVRKKLY